MVEVEVELQGKSKVQSNFMVLPNRESVNDETFDNSMLLEEKEEVEVDAEVEEYRVAPARR